MVSLGRVQATCNRTLYAEWEDIEYFGPLRNDLNFWLYQAETQFKLPNKLALSLSRAACSKRFDLLYFYLAGRMGPIDIQVGVFLSKFPIQNLVFLPFSHIRIWSFC